MLRTVMSSIMRRRRGLNWAIGNSCLRDGLQHPHPLRQETLTKSQCARRGSGFVVCRACSVAWRCKSSTQPDGGEGLAMRKGYRREAGSEGSAEQMCELMDKNRI